MGTVLGFMKQNLFLIIEMVFPVNFGSISDDKKCMCHAAFHGSLEKIYYVFLRIVGWLH